jgi:hypothetical protein
LVPHCKSDRNLPEMVGNEERKGRMDTNLEYSFTRLSRVVHYKTKKQVGYDSDNPVSIIIMSISSTWIYETDMPAEQVCHLYRRPMCSPDLTRRRISKLELGYKPGVSFT